MFCNVSFNICFNKQGVEGATAAAHALSLPAEAYGNDVRWDVLIFAQISKTFNFLKSIITSKH